MSNLPIASSVATELVARQFAEQSSRHSVRPSRPAPHPVRRTRVALAAVLEWAATVVAPSGYRPAH